MNTDNKPIKIAFFGSSLVSAYWNGAATYYRGIIKALNEKGYQIDFYEPDAYERQKHRDIQDPAWANVAVYEATETRVFEMLEKASQADIIIKASGVGIFDHLLEKEVLKLKGHDKMVIFWDVDAPATLERIEKNPDDPFIRLVPQYDIILTYGGGKPVADAYRSYGAKECVPIYNALDPSTHFAVDHMAKFAGDLSFLGNRLPDREKRVGEFFLKPAQMLPGRQFILGGSGWHDKPMPENIRYAGHVYTHEHNAFNCSAKAVLNISRDSMARFGFSPATRIFEAAGAGACIITDYWEGIELFLEPEREILIAKNGEEVALLLKTLTDKQAANIGKAAYERVIRGHTYAHRAMQVDKILKDYFGLADKKQEEPKYGKPLKAGPTPN